MKKIVIYIGFVVASIANAAVFITTTTYIQLAVAILLYLPLTYLAFILFPRKGNEEQSTVPETVPKAITTKQTPPIQHEALRPASHDVVSSPPSRSEILPKQKWIYPRATSLPWSSAK